MALQIRGPGLPILETAGGRLQVRRKYDVLWSDLVILLLTPIGSIPGHRDFGSALLNALFEPNDAVTQALVQDAVSEAVQRFAPHIRIDAVRVTQDGKQLRLLIGFGWAGEATGESREIVLQPQQLIGD